MRLFILPISTRRTLLYCERLNVPAGQTTSLMDRAQTRAAKLWSDWEKKPAGSLQQSIVASGNAALRRIALEEWGLKSVPPLSARKQVESAADANDANTKVSAAAPVEVVYPPSVMSADAVPGVLERLSTEREPLHRKRLIWCFVAMPFTAPIGLIPLIPNIPFFYFAYRAWSHWRALSGGKHIQHLLKTNGLVYSASPILDAIYATERAGRLTDKTGQEATTKEQLLLSNPASSAIAGALDSPSLELELERAIWQVETALEGKSKEEEKAKEDQQQQQQQQQKQQQQQEQEQQHKEPPQQ